jgi:hypothetical protein
MEKERGKSKLSASEKIQLQLSEYLKDASVGDAKYQAFSDLYYKNVLIDDLEKTVKQIKENPYQMVESRTIQTSGMLFVLLDHEIDQKKTSIPGYYEAYLDLHNGFEKLHDSLFQEMRKNPANDRSTIDVIVRSDLSNFMREIRNHLIDRASTEYPQSKQPRHWGIAGG